MRSLIANSSPGSNGSKLISGDAEVVRGEFDEAVELVFVHPRRVVQQVGEGAPVAGRRIQRRTAQQAADGAVQQRFAQARGQVPELFGEGAHAMIGRESSSGMLSPNA